MGNSSPINSVLEKYIKDIVKKVYKLKVETVRIEHPENPVHGDFSTNISLVLASELKQPPLEVAKKLSYEMQENPLELERGGKKAKVFESVEMAPPGFINFTLTHDWLSNVLFEIALEGDSYGSSDLLKKSKTMIEYTDPNPFKVFHAGHLMTNTIGESLARIYEFCGAEVKRANYQGDVGIHVANSIWGLIKKMSKDNITLVDLEKMDLQKRIEYLGQAYSLGATAYEEDKTVREQIKTLNNYLYIIAQKLLVEKENWKVTVNYEGLIKDSEPPFNLDLITSLYKAGKKWSLEYFETMYKRLGTKFDFYYFESKTGEVGLQLVLDHLDDKVFKKDQGAIIFEGEEYGLHTRVFVNSKGLPVYEAKDFGLATIKYDDYKYDRSIIITANEVDDYFKVVLKAMELVNEDLAKKTTHIGHGMLVFKHGKMSSRTGAVIAADELLRNIKEKVAEKMAESEVGVGSDCGEVKKKDEEVGEVDEKTVEKIAIASIKFSILKNGIGNDVIYDEDEATNLVGNTGPYLLYTYARTRSVLEKAGVLGGQTKGGGSLYGGELSMSELDVLRHIYKFPEVVTLARERLSPNLVAGFVLDLAQKYNTFYAKESILKAPSEEEKRFRLYLTQAVGQVIKNGLDLLGIQVVDRM